MPKRRIEEFITTGVSLTNHPDATPFFSIEEPPTGESCGICDEHYDTLEACADCYGEVWTERNRFAETVDTPLVKSVIEHLGVEFHASKSSREEPVEYTAEFKRDGCTRRFGQGRTRAEALAELLAGMLLRKDHLFTEEQP